MRQPRQVSPINAAPIKEAVPHRATGLLQSSTADTTIAKAVGDVHAPPAFVAGVTSGEADPMRAQYFRGNVFVGNLPPDLTEDELAEAFDPFGIVLSAFIARDPETGKRLRYGFVDIATERAAKHAVEAMNGTEIGGHSLDVRISERPAKVKRRPPARSSGQRPGRGVGPDHSHAAAEPQPYRPAAPRRRQPTFQVERRPLPRRV